MFCSKCGRKVADNDILCPGCGARLYSVPDSNGQQAYTAPMPTMRKNSPNNQTPLIIALAAVAVILVLILVVVPVGGKTPSGNEPEGNRPVGTASESGEAENTPGAVPAQDVAHMGSLSAEAAAAYLTAARQDRDMAHKATPDMLDTFTKAVLWDLDQDGEQEMLLSFAADLQGIRENIFRWSFVYSVYDYENGKLNTWAQMEPSGAALVGGSSGYAAVVTFNGNPAILTYAYGGETSPVPGEENWGWNVKLISYPDRRTLRTMWVECASGTTEYGVDAIEVSRDNFLLLLEEIAWLELDSYDQLKYTYGAMTIPELIRELESVAGSAVVEEPLRIVAVDGGRDHTAVLYSDGTVRCVGDNDYGQCDTVGWTEIIQISTLKNHTVGLRADGTVLAVGDGTKGQCDVGSWRDIVYVSAGEHHTVGVREDGTVVVAGDGISGEDDISHWQDVKEVACLYTNTVGLCNDGTVYIAGSIRNGKITGWENIKAICASDSHLVVLRKDGAILFAGGGNKYGERDVDGWNNIQELAAGCNFTVGLRRDGTVLVEGINDCEQHKAKSWTDIILIGTGLEHIIGVRSDGTLVAAGKDDGDGKLDVWKLNP